MALYVAYNCAFSTTTGVGAGTSYATGAKCAIQVAPPSTVNIKVVEWGISFDGSASATPANVELVQASAASTMSNAHSASSVLAIGDNTLASKVTFSTTATGYGNGAITTNTTEKTFDKQYIAQTNQYIKQYPLGREPVLAASKFLQLRVNTTATVNAIAYIMWEEI